MVGYDIASRVRAIISYYLRGTPVLFKLYSWEQIPDIFHEKACVQVQRVSEVIDISVSAGFDIKRYQGTQKVYSGRFIRRLPEERIWNDYLA